MRYVYILAFVMGGVLMTWNPLDKGTSVSLSNADKEASGAGNVFSSVRATAGRDEGYVEFELVAADGYASVVVGIGDASFSLANYPGATNKSAGVQWLNTHLVQPFVSGVTRQNGFANIATSTVGDVFMIYTKNGNAWFGRNGVWTSGDPSAGTSPNVTGFTGLLYPAAGTYNSANRLRIRTQIAEFSYAVPTGGTAWNDGEPAPQPSAPMPVWSKTTSPSYYGHAGHIIERIDVRNYMNVEHPSDVAPTRQELKDFVWPLGRPSLSFTVEADTLSVASGGAAEKWSVTMANGIDSRVFFVPTAAASNGCLFIWHAGHEHHLVTGDAAVLALAEKMLAKGCDILLMSQPLHGVNAEPGVPLHDMLATYDSPTFSSMQYFLEPVILALDLAVSRKTYSRIGISGLSGGGWTAAVAGAIDTRLTHLYPVAGSMPLELDMDPAIVGGLNVSSKRGDYEQSLQKFYDIAGYFDLYVMGAHNRRAMHFFMERDQCCFPAWAARSFEDQLYTIVRDDFGGRLIVRHDKTANGHELTPWATDVIVRDFTRQ